MMKLDFAFKNVTIKPVLMLASVLGITAALAQSPKPASASSGQEAGPLASAIFAGGCFWCIEADFEKLTGVQAVESGYTDGRTLKPTYEAVSSGATGHTEAVRVLYDPKVVSYAQLVDYFWRHIDPTVKDQQFCDVGNQYRSGIYWQSNEERIIAEKSRDALLAKKILPVIHTEIKKATPFYLAEEYHQDYYKKNPIRYKYYRNACGRDARVKEVWGTK